MPKKLRPLTIQKIHGWARAEYKRTGRWPTAASGRVRASDENITWAAIDTALILGFRRLRGGSSLSKTLNKIRPRRRSAKYSRLTIKQILAWADTHYEHYRRWPTSRSGPVRGAHEELWHAVDGALQKGSRGLAGGSSLARVLVNYRSKQWERSGPHLTVTEILDWADRHYKRTGTWPTHKDGRIVGTKDRTWNSIDKALSRDNFGPRGAPTLARLLAKHRNRRNLGDLPRLTYKQILKWADTHYRRTGEWPKQSSGPLLNSPGDNWRAIDMAMRLGNRGLRDGSSIAMLLAKRRCKPNLADQSRLTLKKVLAWADAHYRRTGKWPTRFCGPVRGKRSETWMGISEALRYGRRGLPGGATLAKRLARHRRAPYRAKRSRLTVKQICRWAEGHYWRTGRWPSHASGRVRGVRTETWLAIDSALREGFRGMRGNSSLARFLDKHFA